MRKSIFLLFLLPFLSIANADTTIPSVYVKARKPHFSYTAGPETIIEKTEIESSGAVTLAQVLQNLGGVQLQDMIGNGSQISLSMRGFGDNATSNTLLLINGIPITNPDIAPPNLNIIPITNIKFIEIVAGSESVLYGDQAVGGSINIVTDSRNKPFANITCRTGSYRLRDCLATWSQRKSQFNYSLTLEDNHTDNYRENNAAMQHNLLGNINYDYARGHIKLDYNFINENMGYPGALTAEQVRENRRQATSDTNFFKDTNGFVHLQQKQEINSHWDSTIDAAYRQMNGNGILTSAFTQYRNSAFINPKLHGNINNNIITLGADLQSDHYQLNSSFGDTRDNLQKYGLFGLASIPVNSQWIISLGARGAQQNNKLVSFSNSNTINRAFASTLGAVYLFSPSTKFYLRRAESFRFPKADENSTAPIGVNGLRTQRGAAYETGAEINKTKYAAKVGLFALYLRDEISFDPFQTPQQPFGSNVNLDPTVRYGMTLSGKYEIYSHVNLNAQYNFVDARFRSGIYKGNDIPLVASNILRGGIDFQLIPHWDLYAEGVYTGSEFSATDYENTAGKLGGYTTFNINLRYEYKNLSAALRVNNIFNKEYYFYTVYQSFLASQFFYPAPERNLILTLNYRFM